MPSSERVCVGVRLRPLIPGEGETTCIDAYSSSQTGSQHITVNDEYGEARRFFFDKVIPPIQAQEEVFTKFGRDVVEAVLAGTNGCVVVYGQTGTGKTHTMGLLEDISMPPDNRAGLVTRSIFHLFQALKHSPDARVDMTFYQIYNEDVLDLLNPQSGPLPVRESMSRSASAGRRVSSASAFYVDGLTTVSISDEKAAAAAVNTGLKNRRVSPTLMNAASSRAHTLLTLLVTRSQQLPDGRSVRTRSRLILCDLAGSERNVKTRSEGTRLEEAKSINKSLSALGNVVAALTSPGAQQPGAHAFVPIRDSKLTKLLSECLCGDSRTSILATIGPSPGSRQESLSTLAFATRCKHVKTHPRALEAEMSQAAEMESPEVKALQQRITELARENQRLRDQGGGCATEELYDGMAQLLLTTYGALRQAAGSAIEQLPEPHLPPAASFSSQTQLSSATQQMLTSLRMQVMKLIDLANLSGLPLDSLPPQQSALSHPPPLIQAPPVPIAHQNPLGSCSYPSSQSGQRPLQQQFYPRPHISCVSPSPSVSNPPIPQVGRGLSDIDGLPRPQRPRTPSSLEIRADAMPSQYAPPVPSAPPPARAPSVPAVPDVQPIPSLGAPRPLQRANSVIGLQLGKGPRTPVSHDAPTPVRPNSALGTPIQRVLFNEASASPRMTPTRPRGSLHVGGGLTPSELARLAQTPAARTIVQPDFGAVRGTILDPRQRRQLSAADEF